MVQQRGFGPNPKTSPKNWQYALKFGKVIDIDPAEKTVDVVLMTGGIYHRCPVLAPMASTSSGFSYLPRMHLEKPSGEEGFDIAKAFGKRDIFAVLGFIEGQGTMPAVLGFVFPEKNQFSFPYFGYENQRLERHESDHYHRLIGDTVAALGGTDVPGVEEIRYPDNSYFKAYPAGSSKALADISQGVVDKAATPLIVKKEERKGFYFQHASGTRILIAPDGEVKVSHHTGTWFSIAPGTADIPLETVTLPTKNSVTAPPTAASAETTQVHIKHSSGTTITIDATGKIVMNAVDDINATTIGDISLTASAGIATVTAPTINLRGNISATSAAGGTCTETKKANTTQTGNLTLTGNISVIGSVSATGSITDGSGNTNHHTH